MPWWILAACGPSLPGSAAGAAAKSAQESVWQPGDDIPGWESYDYDCPLLTGGDTATMSLPDVWMNILALRDVDGVVVLWFYVTVASCEDAPCAETQVYPTGAPYTYTIASAGYVGDVLQKTGYYGAGTDWPSSDLVARGVQSVGAFTTEGYDRWLDVEFCFSSVRPDLLRGVLYVTYLTGAGTQILHYDHYPRFHVQFPFEAPFPDHGAWDASTIARVAPPPPSFDDDHYIGYVGGITYDNAWDWDAITDPTIRDAVYDRYTPYNWP